MAEFVNYTAMNYPTKKQYDSVVDFSKSLDDYLAGMQSTYSAQEPTLAPAEVSPQSTRPTVNWVIRSKEQPYSLNFSSPSSSNPSLAEALRKGADYAKAHAGTKTTHNCAKYVSDALEAVGVTGFSRLHGWNYDRVVNQLGMTDITGQSTYKKGDIAVTKTKDGTGHVAICNRDGASINDTDAWSSDFNSSAHPYEQSRIEYAHVFRANKGMKLIKRRKK